MEGDNTIEPLADGVDVAPADGVEAVKNEVAENVFAGKLAEITGKSVADDAAAEKMIKDTFSYVGKRQDQAVDEATQNIDADLKTKVSSQGEQIKQLTEDKFFNENPQYAPVKDLIREMGGTPEEVIKTEAFKNTFEKVQGFEKTKEVENVLESNPRIVETRDKMTSARESLEKGDHKAAQASAVDSVLESMGGK